MNNEDLKCPYCGFEDDISNFPDYFYDVKDIKMIELLEKYDINIVTCGMCGKAIVQENEVTND